MNEMRNQTFEKNPNFVCREIAGEFLLIPIRKKLNQVNCLYVLNETAASFWKQISPQTSVGEILGAMTQEYQTTEDQLSRDLETLIQDLLNIEALQTAA